MAKRSPWKGFRPQKQLQPAPQQQQQITVEQTIEGRFYYGPLPEANDLQAYAGVFPELPQRITAMAEKEQGNRHTLQQRRMDAQIKISTRGQVFGFALAVLIIGIAGYLLATDKEIAGFTTLAIGIISALYARRPTPARRGPPTVQQG